MQAWSIQFFDARSFAVASLLVLIGVGVLFGAWRRRGRHPMSLAVGWGAIAASYYFWADAAGADAGATIGTVLVMLGAITLVLGTGEWRSKRAHGASERGAQSVLENGSVDDPSRTRRIVLRTIAAGPLSLIGALALAMLAVGVVHAPEADRIVLGACVMLLVWPVAMVWICATRRLAPPVVTLAAITIVSLCILPLAR